MYICFKTSIASQDQIDIQVPLPSHPPWWSSFLLGEDKHAGAQPCQIEGEPPFLQRFPLVRGLP